ncbi:hypothetical protein [Methylocystis echinoides]|uniref:hypothetical protein n=1 Tax=Methylocystis echinoides TaxID=29468 RepID=UPI0024930AED|nr:hypothetical protein [Methylocystis echinoides]
MEDRKSGAPNPTERTIVFFTDSDQDHINFAKNAVTKCAASGVQAEHVTLTGAMLPEKIAALRAEGKIGDGTQIAIIMHGRLQRSNNGGNEHLLNGSASTYDVVEAVRKPLNGKDCSANIYISSCYAGDGELRDRIQDLHKNSAGACFLMSSKKEVLKKHGEAELTTMIDLFRYAEENEQQPPPTHIVLARMTSYQMDCISMVDRGGIIIRHAPMDESQFGLAGVIADIDERLRARTEPSTQPPEQGGGIPSDSSRSKGEAKTSEANDKTPQSQQEAKPKLVASIVAAGRLRDAALALPSIPLGEGEKQIEEQRKEVLYRRVFRLSDATKVQQALQSDRKFTASYHAEGWNDSHELIVNCILDQFSAQKKIDEKTQFLLGLVISKKEAFAKLTIFEQEQILGSCDASLVEYLRDNGFFAHDQPWFVAWSAGNDSAIDVLNRIEDLSLKEGLAEGNFESLTIFFLMLRSAMAAAHKDDTEFKNKMVEVLCSLAPIEIGLKIKSKDMPWFLDLTPQYCGSDDMELASSATEPPLIRLLRKILHGAQQDPDNESRKAKSNCVQRILEQVMTTWSKWADENETEWIINGLADDPAYDGNKWDNCHYSLIKTLDGAYGDPDKARRARKIAICKKALQQKRVLFVGAPNQRELIQEIKSRMNGRTTKTLTELGFMASLQELSLDELVALLSG